MVDSLLKRSPDLNVLDYCLWNAINRRMRTQEKGFPREVQGDKASIPPEAQADSIESADIARKGGCR